MADLVKEVNFGRDGVIRTHDPLHPMQVRYQAALRPEPLLLLACNKVCIISQKQCRYKTERNK